MPSSASFRISSQNCRRAAGSKPVVGSSRSSSFRAADHTERHVQAPALTAGERLDAAARLLLQTDQADDFLGVAGLRVVAGEVPHGLAHRQLGGCGFVLPDDADARAPCARAGRRIRTEHRDLARVPAAVALEDLHRGALARSIGSEQAEHLALPYAQIDAVDCGHVSVLLAQPPYVHRELLRVCCHADEPPAEPNVPGRPCVLPYVHRTVDTGAGAAQ